MTDRLGQGLLWSAAALAVAIVGLNVGAARLVFERQGRSCRPASPASAQQVAPAAAIRPRLMADDDCYLWIAHARQMVADHALRVRWTNLDNAPYGRRVWWAAPHAWWLIGLGAVDHLITGASLHDAIEDAGVVSSPLLLCFLLLAIAAVLGKRCGYALPALLMLALVVQAQVALDFAAYRPDHQVLHDLVLCATLLCFAIGGAGWTRAETAPETRRGAPPRADKKRGKQPQEIAELWIGRPPRRKTARAAFIAMGIANGCGLWIGATPQTPVLALVGMAGLATAWTRGRCGASAGAPLEFRAELWRLWGDMTALVSLAAYVLEYAPQHFALTSLEANNPLYALTACSAGRLIATVGRTRLGGPPAPWRGAALLYLAGALALPLTLAVSPSALYVVRDADHAQMLSRTLELLPFWRVYDDQWLPAFVRLHGLYALAPLAAFAIARWGRCDQHSAALLRGGAITTFGFLGLYLAQRRWEAFFTLALLIHAFVVGMLLWAKSDRRGATRTLGRVACAGVIANVLWFGVAHARLWSLRIKGEVKQYAVVEACVDREIALDLGAADAQEQVVLMAPASLGGRYPYFGKLRATASQYSENIAGIKATMDFFSDRGDFPHARRIALARGLTHVIVNPGPTFLATTVRSWRDLRSPRGLGDALGERLCLDPPEFPDWLEPVPQNPELLERHGVRRLLFRVDRKRLAAAPGGL